MKNLNMETKKVRKSFMGRRIYYICPKCGKPIVSRKMIHSSRCMRCGQKLDWSECENPQTVWILAHDSSEASYWAETYLEYTGETFCMDINDWRLSLREFPMLLYFPFKETKDYGRFVRKAAKEATIVKQFE